MSNEMTKEEELAVETNLDDAQKINENVFSLQELEDEYDDVPLMTDPKWSDYVMSKFENYELDPNGRPLVAGLRRVAEELLGEMVNSSAKVIQSPSFLPGLESLGILQPAVVEYEVEFDDGNRTKRFTACADCYFGNVLNKEMSRYLTAVAETRAESRALRKALKLRQVAAEEISELPVEEAATDGKITAQQVNLIDILCYRSNINVKKYISAGKKKYDNIWDVPFGTALAMVEHLSNLSKNRENIDEKLRGYNKDWKDE